MNKKILTLLYLLLTTNLTFTQNNLSNALDSLFENDFFKSTIVSINIYDLTANKNLYSKNEKLLLRPASLQKILTTATALYFLNEYEFKTSVFYDGNIVDSVLFGSIFISGGCDPLFSLKDLDSIVKEIKNYGIKKLEGNLYVDLSIIDSLYWGEGWMWDDDPYPYAPFISPLSINGNSIKVIYRPSEIGKPAIIKTLPQTEYFEIINSSLTTGNDTSDFYISRDWFNKTDNIIAKGKISINHKEDTLTFSVVYPHKFFLKLFQENLAKNGIVFNGESNIKNVPNTAKKILTFKRSLDTVITVTNKISHNLGAELILRILAIEHFGKPGTARNGIIMIDSLITLIGHNPKEYKIVDGSGLSFYNLISSELVVSLLKHFYFKEEKLFIKLYNSFPISGYDGTLKNRMINSKAYKKVRAKTGTLSGISNLAGYMFNKNNHLIAFAIFMQNFTSPPKKARDFQDKICELIYLYE
ncbi:MAG: D-alanyl-D-alanine carboxypeptidase/D-alanyl-D-alanine-endopeptidase [Melioribacter sp.]|nr:D-alanyl-D-alanine carboxypeptidase/D-alanyl-D-alanine-endopeptidase [Melioribacter sp.]